MITLDSWKKKIKIVIEAYLSTAGEEQRDCLIENKYLDLNLQKVEWRQDLREVSQK